VALVAVTFALRFTVFSGASEQRLFGLATAYVIGTWLPIMALNFIEGRRCTSCVKNRRRRQWQQLNYIHFLGCVGHNGSVHGGVVPLSVLVHVEFEHVLGRWRRAAWREVRR
jgi:hypothetical protein